MSQGAADFPRRLQQGRRLYAEYYKGLAELRPGRPGDARGVQACWKETGGLLRSVGLREADADERSATRPPHSTSTKL